MKFKKPSSKTVKDQAALVGGAVVGGVASNGLVAAFHKPTGIDPAKDKNNGMLIRGGVAVASGLAGAAIQGTDMLSTLGKGLLLGMATAQAVEVVKIALADSPIIQKDNAVAKFVRGGLGCGCSQESSLGRAYRKGRGMRSPVGEVQYLPQYNVLDSRIATYDTQNTFDAAMQQGAMISA